MTVKSIDCSDLYRVARGYDVHGGLYDTFEQALASKGWIYDASRDAWLSPAVADDEAAQMPLTLPVNIAAEAVALFKRGNSEMAEILARFETRHDG